MESSVMNTETIDNYSDGMDDLEEPDQFVEGAADQYNITDDTLPQLKETNGKKQKCNLKFNTFVLNIFFLF